MNVIDLKEEKRIDKENKLSRKFYRRFMGIHRLSNIISIDAERTRSEEKTINLIKKVYNLSSDEAKNKLSELISFEFIEGGSFDDGLHSGLWGFDLSKAKEDNNIFYRMCYDERF